MKNTSRKPYIYKVTNSSTGQYYIGSQCIGKIVGMNYFTSSTNKEFWDDFKNYREEKYKIEIIKEFDDPKKCGRAENYIIRNHMILKDGLCLNRACCCCSGEKIFSTVGTHHPHSEETKHKISIAKKGTHHSEETRKRMSMAHKGQPLSEETKRKLSTAFKGRPLPEETKRKLSTAHKGTHPSEETRKKLSEAHKGQSPSEETRKKLSEAHKGLPAWNKGLKGIPSPRRIKISIEGMVFDSHKEASKYYNVSVTTIRNWFKKNQHNAFRIEK